MPLAWEVVAVQFGYIGLRLRERFGNTGLLMIGLLGAINIPFEAALLRAWANARLERYADALKELDHVVRIRPPLESYARAFRERAWFLATCRDASFRNGQQALQDGKTACKLTNWTDESAIDTLAVAYAEVGDFNSAVRYAQQALATKGITSADAKKIQRHLESFQQRKPIRV